MTDTILVKSNRQDNRVVLSEKHPDHPSGEVYIAGQKRNKLDSGQVVKDQHGQPVQEDNIIEVAPTPAVLRKISDGQLVEIKDTKSSAKSSTSDKK